MTTIDVINPATGKVRQSYETIGIPETLAIIDSMHAAQKSWRNVSMQEREKLFSRAAEILRERQEEYATIITEEMGKPITQARSEIAKCAALCDYYVAEGATHLQDQPVKTEKSKSYVCYEPLGIVFAIMPWNYPFWQVMRFAVPNLLGGNAGLLKHAPNSMAAGLAMEALFLEAGFPENLFRSLVADVDVVPSIIEHDSVSGITLTGSERAGSIVAAQAGKALKKVVLELGGTDPYLILGDADLDLASSQCVLSRLNNTGQVCIAAKRIIAVDSVYDELKALILEKVVPYQSGDPMSDDTKLGPMAREDLRQMLHDQVTRAIKAGAHCELGGELPAGEGCFYPATVLSDVKPGNPAYEEELFGPVIILIRVPDEAAAIEMANDTAYGLAGAIFTKDVARGEHIARHLIQAGTVSVNALVSSDPRLPFGGIKRSGHGRELAAPGIHEFMNIKTIMVS